MAKKVKELYNFYCAQQSCLCKVYSEHSDGFEHADIAHQDYYTDKPDASPGW